MGTKPDDTSDDQQDRTDTFAQRMRRLGAEQDAIRWEAARKEWAKEWLVQRDAFFRRPDEERSSAEYDRLWDALAAKFRHRAMAPRDPGHASHAFALEGLLARWRRELERVFLFDVRHVGIDPANDTANIQAQVDRLHRELIEELRLHRHPDRLARYETLDDRTKKRWRIALMRFVDLCAANGWEHFPQDIPSLEDCRDGDPQGDIEVAYAIEELPFLGIRDFDNELFEELLAVWKDGAGTKREGGRSKWLVLDELLREGWQDSTGHRQLKKEWIAAQSQKRNSPTDK